MKIKNKILSITILFLLLSFQSVWAERDNPFTPQLPNPEPPAELTPSIPGEPIRSNNFQVDTTTGQLSNRTTAPIPQFTAAEFVITGLIWDSNRPQAILNDKVVDVGDKISEYEIVSISKTGIQLELNGQLFNVTP